MDARKIGLAAILAAFGVAVGYNLGKAAGSQQLLEEAYTVNPVFARQVEQSWNNQRPYPPYQGRVSGDLNPHSEDELILRRGGDATEEAA